VKDAFMRDTLFAIIDAVKSVGSFDGAANEEPFVIVDT
jgi:hypothetical protein